MEKQRKIFVIITAVVVLLIMAIFLIYFGRNQNENYEVNLEKEKIISSDSVNMEDSEKPIFILEEYYDTSFFDKTAQEIYDEIFTVTEQKTEYIHFYTEDGTLYFDEYEQTDMLNEEGGYVYQWNRRQKIADDVIAVDYNWYWSEPNALYITKDYVLHGTGSYADITLTNVKYASVYADQMLVLTTDGNLWCRGKVYSISDGRTLEYQDWKLVMQNVAYAQLAHYRFMAITENGEVYMWGDNTYGQFGDGTLIQDSTTFDTDCYFYTEPVKVADAIKMVWEGCPGMPKQTEEIEKCRTYFLTEDNQLYVCGKDIGEDARTYNYFGEMGMPDTPLKIICTDVLHKVELQ